MTGVEILLLVIGVVFFIASFFITEKLGSDELSKIGEMSNEEIQRIMERELSKVTSEIETKVEEKADEALLHAERTMERECSEKITAISEYSDTVVESMNKTHNEIMFLYSMLNDKHTELTEFASKLQELVGRMQKKDEEITDHLAKAAVPEENREPAPSPAAAEPKEDKAFLQADDKFGNLEDSNHNAAILTMYKEGKPAIDIARDLELGLGEVQLVIGLYEGKKKK